jgi:hypothetical protein
MQRLGIVLLIAFLPLTASAWTRVADERIAKKGAALAPPDLRVLLEKFESDYRKGLDRGDAEEGEAHRRTQLRQRIERETRGIIAMIRGNEPMNLVVERMGGLAHLVADANSPFHVTGELALKKDYEAYFERRMAKFPTVFYGLEPSLNLNKVLDRTFTRSTRFYPLVRTEYSREPGGNFDDRSTAFGVASVCYSRAVTDLVNVYYFIWREAGGDVRTAPAMRKSNLLVR